MLECVSPLLRTASSSLYSVSARLFLDTFIIYLPSHASIVCTVLFRYAGYRVGASEIARRLQIGINTTSWSFSGSEGLKHQAAEIQARHLSLVGLGSHLSPNHNGGWRQGFAESPTC